MASTRLRYMVRQDSKGRFYVFDWHGKDADLYMPTRREARAKARELNERMSEPPQAA